MRILQLCNKPPYPPNDGSSIAVYNMSQGFIEAGAELHLLTINTKKHFKPDNLVDPDFKLKSHYRSVYHNTNVRIGGALLNLFSNRSYFVSRFHFPAFEHVLTDLLAKNKFDIVQLESIFLGDHIPLIRKHSKAKITIRTHNVEHLIWERMIGRINNPLKKKYLSVQNTRLKKYELQVLGSVNAIIPITPIDRDQFSSLGIKTRCHVSPTGILPNQYKVDHSNEEHPSVFHFGSMDWMPNEEAVLWFVNSIWDIVHKRVPKARFHVIGRGISKRVADLKQEGVVIHGGSEKACDVYHKYGVMVVPLLSGSGMRIKIIEGMAYGKAIVSTPIGAEGIPVTSGKDCILADEPVLFAEAVIDLLNNDVARTSMQLQARDFIESNFNNNVLVKDLVDFYKTV